MKAAAIWFLLLVIAVVAGAIRTTLLQPRIGEHGAHVVGTLVVVAVFAAVIWRAARWISPALARSQLVSVGTMWFVATVTFEFGFGHYVMGHSWFRLLADYNLFAGRLWIVVLVTVLLAPVIAGEVQRGS